MGVVTISGVRDAAYYEEYAALGGPPPRWLGAAPEAALGLARPPRTSVHDAEGRVVERGDLLSLLEGTHPETGAPLLARARRDRVAMASAYACSGVSGALMAATRPPRRRHTPRTRDAPARAGS